MLYAWRCVRPSRARRWWWWTKIKCWFYGERMHRCETRVLLLRLHVAYTLLMWKGLGWLKSGSYFITRDICMYLNATHIVGIYICLLLQWWYIYNILMLTTMMMKMLTEIWWNKKYFFTYTINFFFKFYFDIC